MRNELRPGRPGITFNSAGQAEILLWAPKAKQVSIINENNESIDLNIADFGYWKLSTNKFKHLDKYKFQIDNTVVADPASLSQPNDVHGYSQCIDLKNYEWKDSLWKNIPLRDYIIYEIHTGTFSSSGTFNGIIERLDHLAQLGITAIEIMPVAEFPGGRNWGYDGVFPYAVEHSYGGAFALMKLVDACHSRNIAVILDVVYNHVGPEGNYLNEFGPYFTDKYKTPWGKAINFDDAYCDGVRNFFIENALMWFRDFHIDALRLDAVHAIYDFSAIHILKEINHATDLLKAESGKAHYVIVECDLNDKKYIDRFESGGYGCDAQWNDEFHHALRVTAGQEKTGYYSDFNGVEDLAKSYEDAYVYDGQFSKQRSKSFGIKTDNPGQQFIVFSQNHDQTGNRLLGERNSVLYSSNMCKVLALAVMASPFIPLLFMGEEWGETNPFQYFVSHSDPDLINAVREGRKKEFSSFNFSGDAPDPIASETFEGSGLQWSLLNNPKHHSMFHFYKKLIHIRKKYFSLSEKDRQELSTKYFSSMNSLMIIRERNIVVMNFSKVVQRIPIDNLFSYKIVLDTSADGKSNNINTEKNSGAEGFLLQPESACIMVKEQYV